MTVLAQNFRISEDVAGNVLLIQMVIAEAGPCPRPMKFHRGSEVKGAYCLLSTRGHKSPEIS